MAIRNIDGILDHLEKTSEDELRLLESTGPEYFTTMDLYRLRGQWEVKNRLFRQMQRLLLRLAAVAPGWLVIWFVFDLLQWPLLSLLALAMAPVSYFIFFSGLIFMHYFFRGKGHLEQVGFMISSELRKRTREDEKFH